MGTTTADVTARDGRELEALPGPTPPRTHPDGPVDASADSLPGPLTRPWTLTAVTLAIALTTWRLTTRSLWTDEAISIGAVNQLGETLRGTAGTMGLYYVVLDGWTAVVGTSTIAVRSLSVLFVTGCVLVVSALVRRTSSPSEGGAALLVLATLPGLARAGQEARSYGLTMLLAALMWLCLVRAIDAGAGTDARLSRPARLALIALAPLAAAGVLAHGLFVVQVLALVPVALVLPLRWRLLAWLGLPVGAAGVTAGALLVVGAGDVADWILPLSVDQGLAVLADVLAPHRIPIVVLLALAFAGAVRLVARAGPDPTVRAKALVPVCWALVPATLLVIVSVVRPYLIGRYLLASVPAIAVLVGVGAVTVVEACATTGGVTRKRLAGALMVVVLASVLLIGRLTANQIASEDWRRAAAVVSADARATDGILFTPSSGAMPFTVRTPFEAAWRDVGTPDRAPVPVAGPTPLGEVLRFYSMPGSDVVAGGVRDHPRVWIVHKFRPGGVGDAALREMLAWPELRGHRIAQRERASGGIQVLLLERS